MSNDDIKKTSYIMASSMAIVTLISFFVIGCSSKLSDLSEDKPSVSTDHTKALSSIALENEGSEIIFKSDQRIAYSINKKEDKRGLEILFPNMTASQEVSRELKSNGITEKLLIEDIKEDQGVIAKVKTNGDFEYSAVRDSDNSLRVILNPKRELSQTENVSKKADRIISIDTDTSDNELSVRLVSDGRLDNYKRTLIDKPNPRVVYDIYNVSSDATKEKKITLNSDHAESIRYFNYPNYVRVVVDSSKSSQRKINESVTNQGLNISISKNVYGASSASSTGGQSIGSTKIDKIDLALDSNGKSIFKINTDNPSKYDVIPAGKQIEIIIKDSIIPNELQKAIISNKYESYVEKITPRKKNNDSSFLVDMRQQVPYRVEQTGNTISVVFEKVVSAANSNLKNQASPPKQSQSLNDNVKKVSVSDKASNAINDDIIDMGNSKKAYIGEKIALDFFETDIRNVFRIIQTVSKKNFAIDSDVKGKVTMRMDEPVPWDQVLDLVLKMNGLGMVQEADIIRVATLDRLKREEDMKREVLKAQTDKENQQKALEPIYTEYITINYSNAKNEVMPHLKSLITEKRGSVSVDERNNQIIITDTKEKIAKAKEIIKSVDKVTPQVIIEARVVEATNTVSREIGTKWNAADKVGEAGDDTIFTYTMGSTNLPANSSGFVDLSFTRIAGNNMILNARLEAFESTGDIKIISSPKVLTLDNKEAKIEQGVEYPYLKEIDEDGKASYELKPLTLTLTVKPHVTPDNRIAMTINIKKDDIGDEIVTATSGALGQTKTFARSFLKKEATTELLVDDGETVVIGGIVKTRTEDSSQSVPYLSKIPVLGWLFKSKISDNERSELLLFITPRIVQLEQKG